MVHYDHRVHAGNAGDVWKHFLLLEAADYLLDPGGSLVYVESHAGRPEYALRAPGDWEGGMGRILPLLPSLRNFCYFDILADLNPRSPSSDPQGMLYPGSARLIFELAKRRGAKLELDIWDNDAAVAGSWDGFSQAAESAGSFSMAEIVFHQGDGFAGVLSRLSRSPAGLLFIDPPYINSEDVRLTEKVIKEADDKGWIVLWWLMMDMLPMISGCLDTFELKFAEAGLEGGRWDGAVMALNGAECEKFSHLAGHMDRQIEKFIRILKSDQI